MRGWSLFTSSCDWWIWSPPLSRHSISMFILSLWMGFFLADFASPSAHETSCKWIPRCTICMICFDHFHEMLYSIASLHSYSLFHWWLQHLALWISLAIAFTSDHQSKKHSKRHEPSLCTKIWVALFINLAWISAFFSKSIRSSCLSLLSIILGEPRCVLRVELLWPTLSHSVLDGNLHYWNCDDNWTHWILLLTKT